MGDVVKPATHPRPDALSERLLHVDPRAGTMRDLRVGDLAGMLRPGDVVVLNDAATLPASLPGRAGDAQIELRLYHRIDDATWRVFLFGEGDFHTPTEHRSKPPRLSLGDRIVLGRPGVEASMTARVIEVDARSPRALTIAFDPLRSAAETWRAIYAIGAPVQYAHVSAPLDLWTVQTAYASRPWAVEMPSAGRPLRWSILRAWMERGVVVRSLTHAAGLSSIGDVALDASLPLPERFEIPSRTADAIARARRDRTRVVAVGTSVVRALEGCAAAHDGAVIATEGVTDFLLGAQTRPRVVSGLLTGVHDPASSHYALLSAFAPVALLDAAHRHAVEAGYLGHELGDSCLVLAD